ncbi:hypothetical protein [Rodentibacter trehalosifermentans]|uniref:Uncharacterized protein n=1 Tax=Rodentibacter trehalosifermentans TaxID=1908263 RepID=A0A1V3ISP6_9PAST|nr:hypothetical protein [Rodentibacter trehalosifermentans]OOF45302.1 hypothetical protein BKK51_07055 [Rodentibacter trehalosifermentans]OOF47766.1 hypothetical protein BKK53_10940 [Rodentibacter trehalosifermentans]OOF48168.1 hypothetical protein BKK52_06580 [Rodentibacter trehalosifermentans]
MECNKGHQYAELLSTLPDSQKISDGRHLCAGCAYDEGHSDGFANNPRRSINDLKLPYSQAGTGRHKSARAAYELGYSHGQQKYNGK